MEAERKERRMNNYLFECDREKCDRCSFPLCSHTTDINHAANFRKIKSESGENLVFVESAKMPIVSINLPVRTENILLRASIYSTKQLENMSEDDLRAIPKMTETSIKRIKDAFKRYDLYLKANENGNEI